MNPPPLVLKPQTTETDPRLKLGFGCGEQKPGAFELEIESIFAARRDDLENIMS
jgi:hypothetical protein